MREVVADYPFAPRDLQPVRILPQAREEVCRGLRSGGGWIERLPAIAGKVHFDPTVRIACADGVITAEVVVFARKKTVHFTRRDSKCAQHDGHRRGEVFAMARARIEKKMGERIVAGFSSQNQRVGETSAQVVFDRQGLIEGSLRVLGNLHCEFGNTAIELRRKLE